MALSRQEKLDTITMASHVKRSHLFEEWIPGLLSKFVWTDDPPVCGEAYSEYVHIDRAVMNVMRENGIPGCSVMILRNTEPVYLRSFGWASIDEEPFTKYTACRVGGISKSLTGAAILKLYEQNRLDLNISALGLMEAGELLPFGGYERDPRMRDISVYQLLDLTAGFSRETPYKSYRWMAEAMGKESIGARDVVSYAWGMTHLVREPGSSYEFSNISYITLARVIEIATGQNYEDAVRQLVLAPIGIDWSEAFVASNLKSHADPVRRPSEAHYYQKHPILFDNLLARDGGPKVSEPYGGVDPRSMDGAAGWALSSSGLVKFVAALYGGKLLGPKGMAEYRRCPSCIHDAPDPLANRQNFYSKGALVRLSGSRITYEHAGMLDHAGAFFGPLGKSHQLIFMSNCNLKKTPFIDTVLKDAISDAFYGV